MKRAAEEHLWAWFNKQDRRPLIIRGARQVGKSTLVKLFAQRSGLDLLEINLEKMRLTSTEKDHFDIQSLLDEIQLKTKKSMSKKTIIFFDEIQESPSLLKFLRYFYEERPEIAVIAAGSLLEIALKKEDFSFPVGRVEFYHLGPMTFSEFLLATDNEFLLSKIQERDFSEAVTTEAKRQLNLYYYIGGMPKAVSTYIEEKSIASVRDIQEQIIQAYIADFPKYNSRIDVGRVEKVFYSVINQIGKKIIYQKLDEGRSSRDIKKALELLIDARVILKCNHSNANTVPLMGEMDDSIFKIYFLDVGLVNAIMRLDFETIDQEMKNNFNTKGMIAEQFIAQHLAYLHNEKRGPELFYWLRDKGSQKSEIDFLIQRKDQIIPIEVKSSAAGHLKSLFYFAKEKRKKKAIKVSLDNYSTQSVRHIIDGEEIEFELEGLPQFAIETI
ncbi:MAG: ATP-binding protein [Bacteriovoracaceae bacterium]